MQVNVAFDLARKVEKKLGHGKVLKDRAIAGIIGTGKKENCLTEEWLEKQITVNIQNMVSQNDSKLVKAQRGSEPYKIVIDRLREIETALGYKGFLSDEVLESIAAQGVGSKKLMDAKWAEGIVQAYITKKIRDDSRPKPIPASSFEFTIKFKTIPEASEIDGKKFIVLAANGREFDFIIKKKTWNSLFKKMEEYENWIGIATGKFGKSLQGRLEVIDPSIQVMEIKPKLKKQA